MVETFNMDGKVLLSQSLDFALTEWTGAGAAAHKFRDAMLRQFPLSRKYRLERRNRQERRERKKERGNGLENGKGVSGVEDMGIWQV